jgi:hypothetical protein
MDLPQTRIRYFGRGLARELPVRGSQIAAAAARLVREDPRCSPEFAAQMARATAETLKKEIRHV